jgi:hypothetical protein
VLLRDPRRAARWKRHPRARMRGARRSRLRSRRTVRSIVRCALYGVWCQDELSETRATSPRRPLARALDSSAVAFGTPRRSREADPGMLELSRAWRERSDVSRARPARLGSAQAALACALAHAARSTQEAELALAHLSAQADEAHHVSVAERVRADEEALRRRDLEGAPGTLGLRRCGHHLGGWVGALGGSVHGWVGALGGSVHWVGRCIGWVGGVGS